eukprot:721784_1
MVDIRLSFATILRRAQTEDNGAKDTPLITVYPMQAHQAQNHGLLNASAHQIRPSPTPRRINISARYHLIHFNDDGCKVQNWSNQYIGALSFDSFQRRRVQGAKLSVCASGIC